jgi:hypothetical protein
MLYLRRACDRTTIADLGLKSSKQARWFEFQGATGKRVSDRSPRAHHRQCRRSRFAPEHAPPAPRTICARWVANLSASPDIGRATATMRLGVANASSAAATNEITGGYIGHRGQWNGWQSGFHHREHRLSLKRPCRLAVWPSRSRESHDQGQETDGAH